MPSINGVPHNRLDRGKQKILFLQSQCTVGSCHSFTFGVLPQVSSHGSPDTLGSPEYSSPRKKTKKASLSADQLPRLAPQEDKVRRLNQGQGRGGPRGD